MPELATAASADETYVYRKALPNSRNQASEWQGNLLDDVRNRVRELVDLTEYRPPLSKAWCDFARAVDEMDWQVDYVLNNAWLLTVSFFDEERVILDAFGQWLGGDYGTQRREMRQ